MCLCQTLIVRVGGSRFDTMDGVRIFLLRCMWLNLVVGTDGPARGAATVTRGRLGGSREAVDPDLELTLS